MKNHNKFHTFVIGLMLASLILTACSSASASAPKFPTGKFISADNLSLGYIFNADKTWKYIYYGEYSAEGKYSVKGNTWTEKGTEECPFSGTYEWTFDGSNLTFNLTGQDKCENRRQATDGQTFILQK